MEYITIVRRLMHIALPILASSLVNLGALFINTAIIGQHSPASLYVLGVILPLAFLQTSINESLRVAAITFSSQASGSGDMQRLGQRLKSLLLLGGLIYLLLACAFWLIRDWFMAAYAVPLDRQTDVYNFVQLNILVNALLMVSINMMSSLYAIGHVYRVTVVTITAFAASVALNALFVMWYGLDLESLIISSLITTTAMVAWAATQLSRLGVLGTQRGGWLHELRGNWRLVYSLSVPVFAGYLILFVHSMLFNRLLAQFSPVDIAGFGVAYRIQNIVLLPAVSIGIALAIHVNRLVAAREQERTYQFIVTGMATSLATFAVLALVVFAGQEALPRLISADGAVVSSASHYLRYMGPAYIVAGPLLTLLILFEQTGQGVRSLSFNAVGFAVQLGLGFYLARTYHSLDLVYQASALCYVAAALYILYELAGSRRQRGERVRLVKQV